MRALYLIGGTDEAKIDATRGRLRARAEREGGAAALEVFEPGEGRGMPDHGALLAAIPAMSLMESRRYLLADGVERWRDKQLEPVVAALAALPPDLTVVLISRGKAPAKLTKAVKAADGEIHEFEAPKARDMPRQLVAEAQRRGFRLDPAAARLLVERMGANPVRLANELDRLALWAGEGGEVGLAALEAMVADTQEAAVWTLSDALLDGDAAAALRTGERLIAQGENVTGLIYGLASRLRGACAAAAQLEAGVPPKQVESSLKMHPYAAKLLVGRLREAELADLRAGDRDPRRAGALVPRRAGLRRRAGADPGVARDGWCRRLGGRGGELGRLRLLAGAGVLVQGALLDGLVDLRDEGAVLAGDRLGVAALDRRFEAAEVGLDRAGEQPVLRALALAA